MSFRALRLIAPGIVTLVFGCGGETGGSGGAGSTGTGASSSSGTASNACDDTPIENPGGCPAAYDHALSNQPCTMDGLECWYPGAGDGLGNGCNATALLRCTSDFSDAGAVWVAAQ